MKKQELLEIFQKKEFKTAIEIIEREFVERKNMAAACVISFFCFGVLCGIAFMFLVK